MGDDLLVRGDDRLAGLERPPDPVLGRSPAADQFDDHIHVVGQHVGEAFQSSGQTTGSSRRACAEISRLQMATSSSSRGVQIQHQAGNRLADRAEPRDGDTARPLRRRQISVTPSAALHFSAHAALLRGRFDFTHCAAPPAAFADSTRGQKKTRRRAGGFCERLTFPELLRCDRADPAASVNSHRANSTGRGGRRTRSGASCRGV